MGLKQEEEETEKIQKQNILEFQFMVPLRYVGQVFPYSDK
jgi:hypothetical protein